LRVRFLSLVSSLLKNLDPFDALYMTSETLSCERKL
jgi:hypothetical protein